MLRCKSPFASGRRVVPAGAIIDPTDPIVKGRKALFEEVAVTHVEQTTAAPGEKRARRPRKTKTKDEKPTETEAQPPKVKPPKVKDLLAAVGDDPEAAAAALVTEQALGDAARKTALDGLAAVIAAAEDSSD